MLRDRLVCGIQHERLQSRLLSEPRLTLATAVEIAQAHESAAASAAELSGRSEPADVIGRVDGTTRRALNNQQALVNDSRRASVNDSRRAAGRGGAAARALPPRAACGRCLSRRHCPAACLFRSQACFACGAIGHTRAACRSRTGPQRVGLVEEEHLAPSESSGTPFGGSSVHNDGENEPYYLFRAQSV